MTATPSHTANSNENTTPTLPHRGRLGSAIASAAVTAVVFFSIVGGMTSMADAPQAVLARAAAATRG